MRSLRLSSCSPDAHMPIRVHNEFNQQLPRTGLSHSQHNETPLV